MSNAPGGGDGSGGHGWDERRKSNTCRLYSKYIQQFVLNQEFIISRIQDDPAYINQ